MTLAHQPIAGPSINVVQGEFRVSAADSDVLTTILGSCVAVCLYDPMIGIGGMNHFLLPDRPGQTNTDIRFGTHAMELLINALLHAGAHRQRLEAKAFGGSAMSENLTDVGQENATFAKTFLRTEGIPVISASFGGTQARRIRFWPTTGRVQQLQVPNNAVLQPPPGKTAQDTSDITLF